MPWRDSDGPSPPTRSARSAQPLGLAAPPQQRRMRAWAGAAGPIWRHGLKDRAKLADRTWCHTVVIRPPNLPLPPQTMVFPSISPRRGNVGGQLTCCAKISRGCRTQELLGPGDPRRHYNWTQLPGLSFHEFSLQPVLEVPSETEDESQNNMTETARNDEKARRS
jgi:hypothetical protein